MRNTNSQLEAIIQSYADPKIINWHREFLKATDSFNSEKILELAKIWPQLLDQLKIDTGDIAS